MNDSNSGTSADFTINLTMATHFLGLEDYNADQILELMDRARIIKSDIDRYRDTLKGKTLGLLFQKPSTRTRVSFEVGMYQLGGQAVVLSANDMQLGRGETVADTSRVLSRYLDGLMARLFSHDDMITLADHASMPIINGLTDRSHPCQALTDYLTMQEKFGQLKGLKVVYVGDGNNVAHSLAAGAAKLGVHLSIVAPAGYECDASFLAQAQYEAKAIGSSITQTTSIDEAIADANVVYTDVWVSMGEDEKRAKKLKAFMDYQITIDRFESARKDAIFMHCLPAHYGEEVTQEVAYHPRSVIFDQAENRLHAQKAIILHLLEGRS